MSGARISDADIDPTVAVCHPVVRNIGDGPAMVEVPDLLTVTCTRCGVLVDYADDRPFERTRMQELARRHADERHDGLVIAEGWTR